MSAATPWQELLKPPSPRGEEEDRSATWMELFFDLALVLVVAELAHALIEDHDLPTSLAFVGLFVTVWWAWLGATLYANRYDTDDPPYRLAMLALTFTVAGMAASISDVLHGETTAFAVCFAVNRLLLALLYARAYRHIGQGVSGSAVYLVGLGLETLVWAASVLVEPPVALWLWAAAVAIGVITSLVAGTRPNTAALHLEHLPERFGLLVILVLGESVAGVVTGLHDAHWERVATLTAIAGFLVASALWWSYFDLAGPAARRQLHEEQEDRPGLAQNAYVYGQLPATLGLVVVGVGIEGAIAHSGDPSLEAAFRVALLGGAALHFAAMTLILFGTTGRPREGWPWPGACVLVLAGVGLVSGSLSPLALVALTAVALVGCTVAGLERWRRGQLATEGTEGEGTEAGEDLKRSGG